MPFIGRLLICQQQPYDHITGLSLVKKKNSTNLVLVLLILPILLGWYWVQWMRKKEGKKFYSIHSDFSRTRPICRQACGWRAQLKVHWNSRNLVCLVNVLFNIIFSIDFHLTISAWMVLIEFLRRWVFAFFTENISVNLLLAFLFSFLSGNMCLIFTLLVFFGCCKIQT